MDKHKLICPECKSDALSEMATKWTGEPVRIQCQLCGFYGLRSEFIGAQITLKFFYTAEFVYDGWLLPEERVGLDIFATLARFEQQAKIAIGNWAHVKEIKCHRVDEPGLAFRFEPADDRAVPAMGRGILDMDINKHWLVYETPEAHARALWNTRAINLRLTLASDMMSAYDISYQEAKDLIERAKNDAT